uniref:Uncharacterized protein n=1 Tax=Arundo donax TaxID=35708 RepID=A0A0A8YJC4_ARUDO
MVKARYYKQLRCKHDRSTRRLHHRR